MFRVPEHAPAHAQAMKATLGKLLELDDPTPSPAVVAGVLGRDPTATPLPHEDSAPPAAPSRNRVWPSMPATRAAPESDDPMEGRVAFLEGFHEDGEVEPEQRLYLEMAFVDVDVEHEMPALQARDATHVERRPQREPPQEVDPPRAPDAILDADPRQPDDTDPADSLDAQEAIPRDVGNCGVAMSAQQQAQIIAAAKIGESRRAADTLPLATLRAL
jgi:hypothetical protein